MRVGELSRRSAVSVPSIKYYLREGLLPPGERTGPNQASYGDEHLRRLRLIRALIDVGGLSVAGARDVLAAVDDPSLPLLHVLGAASFGIPGSPHGTDEPVDDVRERAERLLGDVVAARGWAVDAENPAWGSAVEVLATAGRLEDGIFDDLLGPYADAMGRVGDADVAAVLGRGEDGGREGVIEGVVVGTVLGDALLVALRRLAQQAASARRLA